MLNYFGPFVNGPYEPIVKSAPTESLPLEGKVPE